MEAAPVVDLAKLLDKHSESVSSIGCLSGWLRILLFLLCIPVVLFLVILFILWVPLPGISTDPTSKVRTLIAAISVGLLGFFFLLVLHHSIRKSLHTASHSLDDYFQHKGFKMTAAYGFGRLYKGSIIDVPAEVLLFPSYYLQPWRLNALMYINTNLIGTISNRRPITMDVYCETFHPDEPFSPYYCRSTEPVKMNQMLHNPPVMDLLNTIIEGHTKQDTWELRFHKEKVEFFSRQYRLYIHVLEESLDAFFSLTDVL